MGDRTSVNLTVRKDDLFKNQALFADANDQDTYGLSPSSSLLLVTLTYYDINFANLGFEGFLQENKIPYDKSWDNGDEFTCGTEYCRVLANGNVEVKEQTGFDEENISLDEAIKAYKEGKIGAFLETKKNEITAMDWNIQQLIMQGRRTTELALLSLEQESLDDLVTEMSCELSSELNQTDNEEAQDEIILLAEKSAADINNKGKDEQVNYLLNNGYLCEGVS
jgi:hypothetical protein